VVLKTFSLDVAMIIIITKRSNGIIDLYITDTVKCNKLVSAFHVLLTARKATSESRENNTGKKSIAKIYFHISQTLREEYFAKFQGFRFET